MAAFASDVRALHLAIIGRLQDGLAGKSLRARNEVVRKRSGQQTSPPSEVELNGLRSRAVTRLMMWVTARSPNHQARREGAMDS